MDPFVLGQLMELGLEEYIVAFAANKIDKDNFFLLTETDFDKLIPVVGHIAELRNHVEKMKENMDQWTHSFTVSNISRQRENEDGDRDDAQPSTSSTPGPPTPSAGKRKQNPNMNKRRKRQKLDKKLEAVKEIMDVVSKKISNIREDSDISDTNDDFINFLREKIEDLKTEKKEQIGVFGRTGAGKSSLINAVVSEDMLLPTAIGKACTSVIIKVDANKKDKKYVAEVEFISQEEFDDLLWSTRGLADSANDDESKDIIEKMTALFGNDWNNPEKKLKKSSKYKEVSESIKKKLILNKDSPEELSIFLRRYTKNIVDPSQTMFWPVVKCVTIKVPDNELLQHVTLVDLPGTGDCNKTRNDMWKEMVSCCGTVWVVTEVTRAASEKETWDILQSASRHLGNGGECHNIHFICTKSDSVKRDFSPAAVKNEIFQKLQDYPHIQNQFDKNSFKVFIVSTEDTETRPVVNEIDELQDFLQSLNDEKDFVSNYISSAYSILALMKGARFGNAEQKSMLYEELCTRRDRKIEQMRKKMMNVNRIFENSLTEGVNKAGEECEKTMKDKIETDIGSHFQKFRSVMKKNGCHTPKKREQINLNTTLSSFLTDSIDLKFRKAFPNSGKDGPFYGSIRVFSLDCEQLSKNTHHREVKLQLIFLKKEEEKLKTKLCKLIRERKKHIYNCLTDTVEEMMEEGYKAAERKKKVKDMRKTILEHVREKKGTMFEEAKKKMLVELDKLRTDILFNIYHNLEKAMILSLEKEVMSVPDVSKEFTEVKRYYNEEEGN